MSSGVFAKYALVLAVFTWAVFATVWLLALSSQGQCPMSRSTRMADLVAGKSLRPVLNSTTQISSVQQSRYVNVTMRLSSEERTGPLKHYSSQIYGSYMDKGCTMVMLTYKREELLPRVLKHYCKVHDLVKIVVVWNDIDTPVPQALFRLNNECRADLKFIVSKENRLTNRYVPRSEIQTECVCLMDDDRIVEVEDMKFGFKVWQSNRHRVVGFEERSFIKDSKGKYVYTNYERRRFFKVSSRKDGSTNHLPPGYSIEVKDGTRYLHVRNKTFVLGKASAQKVLRTSQYTASQNSTTTKSEGYNIMLNSCFLHRAYLEMYFDPLMVPPSLLDYVNEQKNCEDILMSIVVTKFLKDIGRPQCGALAVKSEWISNLDEESHEQGLSSRPDHYIARSSCLEKFFQSYGYLPLHTSRLIMTKVAYHL